MMAPHEFDQWIEHHTALFPSMIGWLAKLTKDQQTATLAAWSRLLAGVTLDAARVASDRMMLLESIPRYERHPATIAKMAKRDDDTRTAAATTARFGAGTVSCRDCDDLGRVYVFLVGHALARWIEAERRFGGGRRPPEHATGLVRCDCDAGVAWDHLPRLVRDTHAIAVRHPAVQLRHDPELAERRRADVDAAKAVVIGGGS